MFTHGLQVGMEDSSNARNLRTATNQLIQGLAQSNPQLRQSGTLQQHHHGGPPGPGDGVDERVGRHAASRSASRSTRRS